MSKPRFKLVATFDTAAHGLTVMNSLSNQLVGKDVFEQHSLNGFLDQENGNAPTLIAEWRFNSAVDRDALKDWARNQIESHPQVKNWTQTARLSWHRCTHNDQTIENCKTTDYFEWVK